MRGIEYLVEEMSASRMLMCKSEFSIAIAWDENNLSVSTRDCLSYIVKITHRYYDHGLQL